MLPPRIIGAVRRASTERLLVTLAVAFLVVGSIGAIAIAATSGGPVPPPKPLAAAVHDALTAPRVDGVTARIQLTNKLIDSSAIQGSDPLLSGASGRLWIGAGHRFRLELQSDRGDVQVVSDGSTLGVYDPGMNVAYRIALPQDTGAGATHPQPGQVPTLAQIQDDIDKLMQHATLSGAEPTDVAGRAAYDVRISPQSDGGLVGAAQLAWDAATGVPLRIAVYAKGDQTPVLDLRATDISFGSVPASTFDVPPPAGVKVVDVKARHARAAGARGQAPRQAAVTGVDAVSKALPFALSAPPTLGGMARSDVRLLDVSGEKAALVTYGRGLGGLAVLERPAGKAAPARSASRQRGDGPALTLPTVDVGGAKADVLPTALGTLVRFTRAGVMYVVAGSVPQSVAEAAARGL